MKVRRVEIENFRGIKRLDLALGDTVVLIGENNSGKSTILDALRICLNDVRSRKGLAFDAYDFHLEHGAADPAKAPPIRIRLTFQEDAPGEWEKNEARELQRANILQVGDGERLAVIFEVTARYDLGAADFVQDWQFLNSAGAALTNVPENAVGVLRGRLAFHYLPAMRDAARNFDPTGRFWRPFLKRSRLSGGQADLIEAKLREVNDLVIGSHAAFEKAIASLKEIQRVVPLASGEIVSVEAIPARLFDILAKAQVLLGTLGGAKIPVGRHGEGTQSLAVLMLFNAFLGLVGGGTPIIALEEPEAHLHPNAVRTLWRLLEELPGQKIISTHSGDLLSEVPVDVVRRLRRSSSGVSEHRLKRDTLDERGRRLFNYHVRHQRGELLFARCWLLVEGETEVTLLPEIGRLLKLDLDRAGVRCVAHRHASIEVYIKAAEDFGIRWCVLAEDDEQGKQDQRTVRAYLEHLQQPPEHERLHVLSSPDIEQYLCHCGYQKVYEDYLTEQPREQIKVDAGDPAYIGQLVRAVRRVKTAAAIRVAEEIAARVADGRGGVPPVLEAVVRTAVRLAEEG